MRLFKITTNLNPEQWYVQSEQNDLLYWGLDYPPLTAYHHYALGIMYVQITYRQFKADVFGSDLVTSSLPVLNYTPHEGMKHLHTNSSCALQLLSQMCWSTSLQCTCSCIIRTAKTTHCVARLVSLDITRPSLINSCLVWNFCLHSDPARVDLDWSRSFPVSPALHNTHWRAHCSRRFNSICLGFTVLAIHNILRDRDLIGSFFFVLALNYKQMSLYYAPVFFFYLLGKAINQARGNTTQWMTKVLSIGVVVLATFALCWRPFLRDKDLALQVLSRMFPVGRGLFEDKVANFWCTISPFIKLKIIFSPDVLLKMWYVLTHVVFINDI